MPLYLGTDDAGTSQFSLQDFLPTPITFLRESLAIESLALILGLAIVWLVLLHGADRTQSAPRAAKYFGLALAVVTLATANWLAFRFKWKLAYFFGEPLMAQLSPLKQYSTTWYAFADFTNFAYYSILVGLVLFIWRRRETLGSGALRIICFVKSAHEKV